MIKNKIIKPIMNVEQFIDKKFSGSFWRYRFDLPNTSLYRFQGRFRTPGKFYLIRNRHVFLGMGFADPDIFCFNYKYIRQIRHCCFVPSGELKSIIRQKLKYYHDAEFKTISWISIYGYPLYNQNKYNLPENLNGEYFPEYNRDNVSRIPNI